LKYNYSLSFSRQGNYVSARAYYERALQLVPDSKLLQENLAKLDRLEKRLQEVQEKDQM
uniref:Tetratricopeptide repeat protein n=1 Tax=Sus scrofa TaxID=9823 RepID=A0A8D1UJ00_PIG